MTMVRLSLIDASGYRTPLAIFSAGAERTVWIMTKPLDLGSQYLDKHVSAISFDIEPLEAIVNTQISVGFADRMKKGPDTWLGPYSLVEGDSVIYPDRFTARYVWILLEDFVPNVIWKLSRVTFFGFAHGVRL